MSDDNGVPERPSDPADDPQTAPSVTGAGQATPLAFAYDRSAAVILVPIGLVTALTFNIAALTLPFLEIRIWPAEPEAYSIPHTVGMMWSQLHLRVIAILIAAFSLVFPFLKLLGLAMSWYAPLRRIRRGRLLSVLGALGRWSLLDVFVALVMIVLAHDQGRLFVTGVKPGLGLFLAAILLAMVTGDVLHALHDRCAEGESPTRPSPTPGMRATWKSVVIPVLALGALAALLAALSVPYLKITAWFLTDRDYSVATSVVALATDGDLLFAVIVAVFLGVTPAARIGWTLAGWFWRGHPRRFERLLGQLRVIERWAMLDVFGLAVALFLLEGSHLVPIEARGGVWLVVLAVAASIVLGRTATRFLAQLPTSGSVLAAN